MLLRMAVNRLALQKRKLKEVNENRKREVAMLLQQEKVLQARVKVLSPLLLDFSRLPSFPRP